MSLLRSSALPLRRPWTVYVPSGFLSGMSLAANDGGGGRSTLIGAIAVASGSGPIDAPDELDEQPAATTPSTNRRAVFMQGRLLILGARRKPTGATMPHEHLRSKCDPDACPVLRRRRRRMTRRVVVVLLLLASCKRGAEAPPGHAGPIIINCPESGCAAADGAARDGGELRVHVEAEPA